MSRAKWTLIAAGLLSAVCLTSACSSGSSSGKDTSTTTPAKSGTVADTAWREVAQGVLAKQNWKVSAARSSTNWRCYDVEGLTPSAGTTSTTVANGPTRDGRSAYCVAPTAGTGSQFAALVNGADGKNWVLVGAAADGIKKASLVFADGSSTPLNIDPHSRLVIWKGPASLKPKQIRAGTTTCTIVPTSTTEPASLCAGVSPAA
jgi:hypothetical protein